MLLVAAHGAGSQQTPAAADTQLSPGAAYSDAMHPVDVARRSIANWSPIEQAALGVAIKRATAACAARETKDYGGPALIDLAHLCALGLSWPRVVDAADAYLRAEASEKPQLGDAYASKLDAQLQMKDEADALVTAKALLEAVPYNAQVADATDEALKYMKLLYTADALALAEKRQPNVLALLKEPVRGKDAGGVATAVPPTGSELYRQGLVLAELQQLAGEPDAAETTFAALNSALPAGGGVDDRIAIEGMRRRYALLGKPLVTLGVTASLDAGSRTAQISARNAVTALLLFPDWCAQCIRLALQIPRGVFTVEGHVAYMHGLLAQTMPAEKPGESEQKSAVQTDSYKPSYAAEYLKGTPTMTVAPTLLEVFDAIEVPLLIVADGHGVVRLIDGVDEEALRPGNTVDTAIAHVAKQWPSEASKPADGKKSGH